MPIKVIKLKKKNPVGRPPVALDILAGRAEAKTMKKVEQRIEKSIKTKVNSGQDTSDLKKLQEYYEFLYWMATPIDLRTEKTQKEFALRIKVAQETLVEWKKREGFYEELNRIRISIFSERASNVLRAVERRALERGGNQDAALFFKATGIIKDQNDIKLGVDEDLKKALNKIGSILPD